MISDEGIVDLTNSDEEEMEASTSTEEGNEQQIESDEWKQFLLPCKN